MNKDMTKALFKHLDFIGPQPVFLLQAPRTGCTLLYQTLIFGFDFAYFCNAANDFYPNTPEVIIAAQAGMRSMPALNLENNFGKTSNLWAPSEASGIMSGWFGGGHPSEIHSIDFTKEGRPKFENSISNIRRITSSPLLIKNAWNSFRIKAILEVYPKASFIWSRRDAVDAARSDFKARIKLSGSPNEWSSATPANYKELLKKPTHEHIIENQFEFTRAISDGLKGVPDSQKAEIWYEDFVVDPMDALNKLKEKLDVLSEVPLVELAPELQKQISPFNKKPTGKLPNEWVSSYDEISDYADENAERFGALRRTIKT